jgi:C4-dicarboxylate-specific signal transduction histidine kinase
MPGKAAPDRPGHACATTRTDAFDDSRDEWRVQLERVHGLGILTASIVHEVSQPLFGIATNASACLRMLSADPPNVEGARETVRRTLRDVNRAAEVISRLRALFTERGHPAGSVDLNKAVLDVLATSRSQLRKARVRVRHSLADGLPVVAGDRIQLEQVVHNLIRNAVEAMASVGGKRARTLTITTRCVQNGNALLSVHDVGVGIADQNSNDVFKPFYSTKPEGMGIGLCISRAIVEHHGGRLWVTANEGPGVTFWLSLPRARRRHDSGFLPAAMETIAVAGVPSLASRP